MSTDTADPDIIIAFEELRREVSLTRAALEGITAARERITDDTPTLCQIAKRLRLTALAADGIEKAPAISLSPDAMAAEIVKAGTTVRAVDAKLIAEARDALSRTIGQIDGMVKRGQAADRQFRGAAMGRHWRHAHRRALWSALPGVIARSLPASWQVPGWMAVRTIGDDPARRGTGACSAGAEQLITKAGWRPIGCLNRYS